MKLKLILLFQFSIISAIAESDLSLSKFKTIYESGLQLDELEIDWLSKSNSNNLEISIQKQLASKRKTIQMFKRDYGNTMKISGIREIFEKLYDENDNITRVSVGFVVFYYNPEKFVTGPHMCAGYLVRNDGEILERKSQPSHRP